MERRPISKKIRFEVFKRDAFMCQFCGETPPAAVLEVDHIIPVAHGGGDDIDNLHTACFACNRGKGATMLDVLPQSVAQKAEIIKEKEAQLRAYNKALKAKAARVQRDIDLIEKIFQTVYPTGKFSNSFKLISLERFIRDIPSAELEANMDKAVRTIPDDPNGSIKYFCGICWRTIKGDGYCSRKKY